MGTARGAELELNQYRNIPRFTPPCLSEFDCGFLDFSDFPTSCVLQTAARTCTLGRTPTPNAHALGRGYSRGRASALGVVLGFSWELNQ